MAAILHYKLVEKKSWRCYHIIIVNAPLHLFLSLCCRCCTVKALLCQKVLWLYLWWNEWVWSQGTLECLEVRGKLTCLKRKDRPCGYQLGQGLEVLPSTVSMHAVVKYALKLVTMQSETRSRVSKLYFTLLRCAFSFLLQSKKRKKKGRACGVSDALSAVGS